jgi:hypothetical protein
VDLFRCLEGLNTADLLTTKTCILKAGINICSRYWYAYMSVTVNAVRVHVLYCDSGTRTRFVL